MAARAPAGPKGRRSGRSNEDVSLAFAIPLAATAVPISITLSARAFSDFIPGLQDGSTGFST
jgi:hypothetical protein